MNPLLTDVVLAYQWPNSPSNLAYSDTGNPSGLQSFNPTEPAFVFWEAGPLALASIFSGPGLKRAVFNAAQWILTHGPVIVTGAQPVTTPVLNAVAAYVAANPGLVPVGGYYGILPAPPVSTAAPQITPPTPFEQQVCPIPNMTLQDLLYAVYQSQSIAGGSYGALMAIAPDATQAQIVAALQLLLTDFPATLSAYQPASYSGPYRGAVDNYVLAHLPPVTRA